MTDEAWDTIDRDNPPDAYRYTDADVRTDVATYRKIAHGYLERYAGEFELLLSYRRRIAANLALTVPMIRATLNCMRFDGAEDELPPHPARAPATVVSIATRQRSRPELWPSRPRPRFIRLKTMWHKEYGVPSWYSAARIHRVHPDSHFEYDTERNEFRCRLWWACKPEWDHPRTAFELVTFDEARAVVTTHAGWLFCRKCFKVGA